MLKLNTDGTIDETIVNRRKAQDLGDEILLLDEQIKMFEGQKQQLVARRLELQAIIDQIK